MESVSIADPKSVVLHGQNNMIAFSPPSLRRVVDGHYLQPVLEAFLSDRKRAITEATYVQYANDLAPFLSWWPAHTAETGYIVSEAMFTLFLRWLENDYRNSFGKRATPYTIWRVTKRIRQALVWAHTKGLVPVAIHDLCPLYNDPERLKYYPDQNDLQRLFDAVTGETRLRDAALMAFAISTGARRMEIQYAQVEEVRFDTPLEDIALKSIHTGYIRLRVVKNDAAGVGIGRVSLFGNEAGLLLKCYLRSVNRRSGSVFDLSDNGIRKVVHHTGMRAGVPAMHPHAFRSALIDYWREEHATAGPMADIALRLQVGHAIPNDATNHYTDTRNEAKVLRRIRQFHTSPLKTLAWRWNEWPVHVE